MTLRSLADFAAGRIRAGLSLADRFPRWVHVLAAIGWATFLWQLSAQPGSGGRKTLSMVWLWNSAHVVAYFALGALCFFAVRVRDSGASPIDAERAAGLRRSARWRGLGAAAIGTVYGIVDEWHQSHVPGRACSAWDMGSDVLGACLAVAVLLWAERRLSLRWALTAFALALITVSGATRAVEF